MEKKKQNSIYQNQKTNGNMFHVFKLKKKINHLKNGHIHNKLIFNKIKY